MEGGGNKEPESSGKKGQEEGEKKRKGKEGKWVRARERGGGGRKGGDGRQGKERDWNGNNDVDNRQYGDNDHEDCAKKVTNKTDYLMFAITVGCETLPSKVVPHLLGVHHPVAPSCSESFKFCV